MSPPPVADELNVRYAGFWIRVGASLIDMLITVPIYVGLMFLKSPVVYLAGIVVLVCYKPILEGLFGATVGKMAVGLLVVDKAWVKIGLVTAVIRASIFIVSALPGYFKTYKMKVAEIGFTDLEAMQAFNQEHQMLDFLGLGLGLIAFASCVVVAFNARKRGLHDMLADTFVVYKESLPRG